MRERVITEKLIETYRQRLADEEKRTQTLQHRLVLKQYQKHRTQSLKHLLRHEMQQDNCFENGNVYLTRKKYKMYLFFKLSDII